METGDLIKIYDKRGEMGKRWVTVAEAATIVELAKEYTTIVESGTANGWSALFFAAKGFDVITFDPYDRPKVWDLFPECSYLKNQITYVQGRFEEEIQNHINDKISYFFFIDGDHDSGGVNKDFSAVKNFLGKIAFHDFNLAPVVRCVDRLDENEWDVRIYNIDRKIALVERKNGD